jgi:hypothetical protein
LSCDDEDDCTDNSCDPELGCFYPLIDADADGHAPTSLGECGTDCDDDDDKIYEGAAELCDAKDNDCDGDTDETAPTWYRDCDADGFAPMGAPSMQQCEKPPADPACGAGGGDWTEKRPINAQTTDCRDDEPGARPRLTTAENDMAWSGQAIAGAPTTRDYDWNCDDVEEKRFTVSNVSTTAMCEQECTSSGMYIYCFCDGADGWVGATPECHDPLRSYSQCAGAFSCSRTTISKEQECR